MTDLTRSVTTKDLTLVIAGRTLAQLSNMSISGDAGLADVSVLSEGHKRWIRTKKEFTGSLEYRVEDMGSLGLTLGDYEVDPSQTESISLAFNPPPVTIKHIQGDKTNGQAVATGELLAQKFRASGATLNTAQIYVNSGSDATVTVTVEADVTGSPSGTPLDTDTVDCSSAGWKTATLDAAVLTMDDFYWIVIDNCDTATFAYADTDYYTDWGFKFDSGGGYGSLTITDLAFQLSFEDNTTYLQIQLTDGITTHTIKGELGAGAWSSTANIEDPITAELAFKSEELVFSEVV